MAISARGVTKRFGAVVAVHRVSFEVPPRCVCGLLGPNGAGKTTTIRMLAAVLVPDEGELRIAGHELTARAAAATRAADAARRAIGYLPESAPAHPELRTREFLAYRAALAGRRGKEARAAIERVVAATQVGEVFGRLMGALSKGFRQRVGLAAALLGDPAILILDEPSVGLDPHQLLEFRALLRALGRERTVLLSSHILAEVEATCDRAVLLAGGHVVAAGTLEALRREGAQRYVIEASGSAARAAVASVAGLGSVREMNLEGEWRRITADAAGDADHRAALAQALAAQGIAVRELRREQASLESLFVAATRRAPGGASAA